MHVGGHELVAVELLLGGEVQDVEGLQRARSVEPDLRDDSSFITIAHSVQEVDKEGCLKSNRFQRAGQSQIQDVPHR